MNTTATHDKATNDDNCCYWIQNSDTCDNLKIAGVTIVAALAAIAIVGGSLLVLAGQGFNLHGINSIAQMVEAQWVYIGLGIAGGVALIDTILIVTMLRGYLNKNRSEEI